MFRRLALTLVVFSCSNVRPCLINQPLVVRIFRRFSPVASPYAFVPLSFTPRALSSAYLSFVIRPSPCVSLCCTPFLPYWWPW